MNARGRIIAASLAAAILVGLAVLPCQPVEAGRTQTLPELPSTAVDSGVPFGSERVVTDTANGARAVHAADVDGDAFDDHTPVLNMVLLMDTSESMGYATCDPCMPESQFFDCLTTCRNDGTCQPFEDVRDAASLFVGNLMRDGTDRVAVYHLDRTPVVTQSVEMFPCSNPPNLTLPITLTPGSGMVIPLVTDKNAVLGAINHGQTDPGDPLNVYIRPRAFDPATNQACISPVYVGGYRGEEGEGYGYRWASTNTGGGLRQSILELVNNDSTDAIWVIVLLSDGAANATDQAADVNGWWTCPSPPEFQGPPTNAPNERNRLLGPFCRDADPGGVVTRHCPSLLTCSDPERVWYTNRGETDLNRIQWFYDADDYARDMADLASSQGIAIYTIGFGPQVVGAGENLLRYIADVGDDGERQTAPCGSDSYWDDVTDDLIPDPLTNCGNYYYAPDAAALEDAFESIASRIFSRIAGCGLYLPLVYRSPLNGGGQPACW